MPTETTLNSLKVHKVPDFETWEENYGQVNGIGTSDVVVIPPEELKKGVLPEQTGNSGKFLATDGTDASWETVDALPSQSGNSGKILTTNGTTASWANETDPVFEASPAAGITQNDIDSWDAKVSDDKTWNGVTLDKALANMSNTTQRVPFMWDTNGETSMRMGKASKTPTANSIAMYDGSSYLQSTTPSANDNSTKVATTAYVDAAIPDTSGFITTETDPTVPSWAKASTKPSYNASEVGAVATSAIGAANGVVPLNASSKIDSTYLPSYVDDVIEGYYYNSKFYTTSAHTTEITGETGKIFVDLSTNKTYRYGGSSFTEISQGSIVSVSRDLTSGTKIGTLTINGTNTDLYAPTPETFTVTGGASTIVSNNLTASRALISNSSGKVAVSDVTSTELGYLDGVTSAIQTQLDNKQAKITASGLLKGNGSGTISAATAGTDYQAPLPSQTNNSGKYLTTNGSSMSWASVDALPSQSGNSGKYLTTNGTSASWTSISIPTLPTIDSTPTNGNTSNVVSSDGVYDKIMARSKIYTATCSTAAATAAKVATLDDSSDFSLTAGVMVAVRFTYGNSATTPTLRVDGSSTGTAKTIAIPSSVTAYTTGNGTTYNTWGAYETVLFTYTGTYWTHIPSGYLGYLAYNLANSKQDAGNYKTIQTAVTDPTASGNSTTFIDTISQNTNGVISVTKKNVNFPVTSVNSKTGAVTLTASDVGALPSSTTIPTVPTMDASPTDGNSNNTVSSNGVYDMIMGRTKVYTATCSTAAATQVKVATLDDSTNFSLTEGVKVAVTFTYGNSFATPTLRVDGTTTGISKTIAIPSSTTAYTTGNGTTYNTWGAYETVLFTYTGTYWAHIPSGYLGYLAYNTASGRQAKITASGILKGDGAGTISAAVAGTDYPPVNHATTATTYGVGDSSNYGHVKLSDSTSSTSSTTGGIAATPAAVKAAYDLANGKQASIGTTSGILKGNGSGTISAAVAGTDYQAPLPSQTNNSGKFLTTNGSALSWGTVDALPSQSGNSGKYLTTNGSAASWATVDLSSKANIASPTFTGTPAAPTATAGTNTTQIATTAFVNTALTNKITYGTSDLTAGSSALTTGTIYLVYE